MISVTRLNGKPLVVNAELIRSVEENPDTTITLINGDRMIVRETMSEIVSRSIEYGRQRDVRFGSEADIQRSLPECPLLGAKQTSITIRLNVC